MSAPVKAPTLDTLILKAGAHSSREDGVCVMEAAAWLAGLEHSDAPACVSPVIRAFCAAWNDAIPDDHTRTRLLRPLLPVILDTRSTPEVEERRSFMALDWLIREHLPAWLDLVPALQPHADALRAADPITSLVSASAIRPLVLAARKEAAARAAAWDAALAAARDALKPTAERLQLSAQDLVRRMCAEGGAS